jgi:hypothetical protein
MDKDLVTRDKASKQKNESLQQEFGAISYFLYQLQSFIIVSL